MRRRTRIALVPPAEMDTSLIGQLEISAEALDTSLLIRAVLFASGELKQLETDTEVYGLVMAGYEGFQFGDDGVLTARVASELPLQRWDGVRRLESEVNRAVKDTFPGYCAEHVGFIAMDQAAVCLDVDVKRRLDVACPAQVTWREGSLTTAPSIT